MEVLSTITLVMKALIDKLKLVNPDMHAVYNPQMDYESSVNRIRANKGNQGTADKPSLPMLAYNRSSLRRNPDIGQRSAKLAITNLNKVVGTLDSYKVFQGEFDFRFAYFTKEMADLESFEVEYNSYEGFTKETQITVNTNDPNIGTLTYFITWTFPLEDIDLAIDGNYFKSVAGSVKVAGWFISGKSTLPVIKQINSDIKIADITIRTEITNG